MKKTKIQLSFARYTDSRFLTKAGFISSSMKNNATIFKNPDPDLAVVDAAVAAYSAALEAAENLGKVIVRGKNTSRLALENVLFLLGLYVMYTAQNDETILGLSGYTLVPERQPRNLNSLGNVTLKPGISSGQLTASVKRGNASSFSFDITDLLPTEKTNWISYPCNNSVFTFTDLVPGKQYWVKVAGVGYRKQVVYSNVGTEIAKL